MEGAAGLGDLSTRTRRGISIVNTSMLKAFRGVYGDDGFVAPQLASVSPKETFILRKSVPCATVK